MNTTLSKQAPLTYHTISASSVLKMAAIFWTVVFLLGQWSFFYYLIVFYGINLLSNNMEAWNVFQEFGVTSYIPGDTGGNIAFGSHALGASFVALAGSLQLIPQIRQRYPVFHRWNGRFFLVTCIVLSLSGFYLAWIRNEAPSEIKDLKNTINGLLVFVCSYFTLRYALKRNIKSHNRWALALILEANGQWFMRIGTLCYMTLGNLIGKASFSDPFFLFWNFGAYLVPLAILMLYFFAHDNKGAWLKGFTAVVLTLSSLLMTVGILVSTVLHLKIMNGEPLGF